MVATEVTEVAVKFVTGPTATGGSQKIDFSGSTDVAGYVYCGVSKTHSRMLADTTTTTATKTDATKTTATTTATKTDATATTTATKTDATATTTAATTTTTT